MSFIFIAIRLPDKLLVRPLVREAPREDRRGLLILRFSGEEPSVLSCSEFFCIFIITEFFTANCSIYTGVVDPLEACAALDGRKAIGGNLKVAEDLATRGNQEVLAV